MSRFKDELVRAVFELHRDLVWVETLEPKFNDRGENATAMLGFRAAWNQHCEKRDWAWWQNEAKRFSTGDLDDMRMDITAKLESLGLRQWERNEGNKAASTQEKLQQLLKGTLNQEEKPQERSRANE